jgi:hypothetical protein
MGKKAFSACRTLSTVVPYATPGTPRQGIREVSRVPEEAVIDDADLGALGQVLVVDC